MTPSVVKWYEALINRHLTITYFSSDKAFSHLPRFNLKTIPCRTSPSVNILSKMLIYGAHPLHHLRIQCFIPRKQMHLEFYAMPYTLSCSQSSPWLYSMEGLWKCVGRVELKPNWSDRLDRKEEAPHLTIWSTESQIEQKFDNLLHSIS